MDTATSYKLVDGGNILLICTFLLALESYDSGSYHLLVEVWDMLRDSMIC